MKKSVSVVLLLSMVISMLIFSVTAGAAVRGDVDGNGSVTAADARITLRCSVQLENLTGAKRTAADMDSDGKITAGDARKILRMSVGLFDTATITVQYGSDYKGDYSSFETIRASYDADYSFPVVITTNADVTDFRIVGLNFSYMQGSNMYYNANVIKNCGTFKAGEKLVVYITCLSDVHSEFGFVYKDGDGTEKAYGFYISGYDGSLRTNRIGIAAFVTLPAVISAMYARDYNGSYSSFETIYASNDLTYRFPVILFTDSDVTDFRIVKVSYDYMSGSKVYYEATTVKNIGTFKAGEKIVVYITNKFDLYSEYGIVYKDTDGKEKFYGFMSSGNDGSLMLVNGYISSYTDAPVTGAAKVTAAYGSKTASYAEENTVFGNVSSFSHPVIVRTDKRIEDFTVLGMDKDATTGKIMTYVIKKCGILDAGEEVNIFVTFNTEKPLYGYSYKDSDGVVKIFSITRSAKDSSLVITREKNTVSREPAKISLQAAFGEQVFYDYSYMDSISLSSSQWNYPVILNTNRTVNDLKIHSIEWAGSSYKVLKTYNYGTLSPGEPVVAYVYNHDGIPHYAVSYTDENGKLRAFTFLYPVNGAGDKVYYALGSEIKLS